MRKNILLIASLFLATISFGQRNVETNHEARKCDQYAMLERMQIEDPARYQEYLVAQQLSLQENTTISPRGTVYTIPVVFHILHNGGTENISDAQVIDAVRILNRDYRKQNADVNNVYSTFLPIAGDVEIEFSLAKTAPDGTCFNGITRTQSTQTTNGSNGQSQVNAIVAGNNVYQGVWPHNKYLNIYVCKDIGGAAGYTYLPQGNATANATNMFYNGIFVEYDYCGSIGTSSEFTSRTLTHEAGHWLNLKHIWGDGNQPGVSCGDDGVADTPLTKGFTSCPTASSAKNCNASIVENYENYMDYSYCSKMFTNGQVTRMRTALTSSIAGRNNIWTEANLKAVGVLPSTTSLCSTLLDATSVGICQGASTTFSVTNTDVAITSYSWSFPGGTPATSTQANPTVTYSTAGSYNVSVAITSSSAGSRTITNTSYITVAASVTPVSLPFVEGFVNATFPPTGWTVNNGGNAYTWGRNGTKGTAPTAGNSANLRFDPTSNNMGDIDDLNTPAIDLSTVSSTTLTFDVAYRPYVSGGTTLNDKLEVLISPGCGMPYEVIYSKSGSTLQTEAGGNGYTNPATWRNETVDLTPYIGQNQVKIKFRGTSGWGNQVYIDNVNISGVTAGPQNASFTASSSSVCVGQTVTFTNTSSGATSWNWNFGAGASPATATGAGPHVVTYSNDGAKTISLSINSGASSANNSITVKPLPTVTLGSLPTVCQNASSITLNQGSPAGGTYSGSGVSGTTFNPSTAGSGTKTITYTYTNPTTGCSNSATNQIIVNALPTVALASLPTVCIYHNPITLTQGSPAGGTYSGPGVLGSQFSPSTAGLGSKTIVYSITSSTTGCSNTASNQLIVDGCAGIEDINAEGFKLFPNPSKGMITIVSVEIIDEVVVTDHVGRIVTQVKPSSNEVTIDLHNVSSGSYLVNTKLGSNNRVSQIVVE
ncbi:MAG: M43 family zinc metalloprotease [Crocinitomicaceae bacterium]|nr:M43 family zinc metalloprotease [Crocinitomicaceae bacterium]